MRKLPYKRSNAKGSKYYIDYMEVRSDGSSVKVTRSSKTTDYKLACQILKVKQSEAAKRHHGLIDPAEDLILEHGGKTILQTLPEWEESLRAANVRGPYLQQVSKVLTVFSKACRNRQIRSLKQSDLETFVVSQLEAGRGVSTVHQYAGYIKRYGKWLDSSGKVSKSPFRHFKRSMKGHEPKRRRPLTHDEVAVICKYLETARERYQHTSEERKALYLLAIRTGLRIKEIAQLRTRDFVFGTTNLVLLPKNVTKNRKRAKLYLGESIGTLMEQLVSDGRKKPFRITSYVQDCAARMIKEDMRDARATMSVPKGFLDTERVDFHALRHTCGAWLCWEGVSIQVVQRIMRHSSITLTIDTYGHLLPDELEHTADKTDSFFAAYLLPH